MSQTSPVSASAIWSSANLINLMTAVSKANPSLTEQELFKEIAFVMIKHLGFAQTPQEETCCFPSCELKMLRCSAICYHTSKCPYGTPLTDTSTDRGGK